MTAPIGIDERDALIEDLKGNANRDGWLLGPWKKHRICFVLSYDDLWVGFFWEREEGVLYFAPFPMLIFGLRIHALKKPEPTT